ncbi:MAG: hypothetical protein DELT_02511 [Desulfovibrio sp.]
MKEFWTNTFSHVWAGFDFAIIVYWLLAGIAVLVLLRVTGLLRRENKWHRLFVCLYYIYIPAVFIGCGALWSSVSSVDYTIRRHLTEARATIVQSSVSYTQTAWDKTLGIFEKRPGLSPKELCLTLTREYADEIMGTTGGSWVADFLSPVTSALKEGVAVSLAAVLEKKAISKVSDTTKLDKDLLETLWSRDIVEAMNGGLVFDLIYNQVHRAVSPLYSQVKTLFAMLLAPVILEILLALYLRRKAKQKATPAL